MTDEAVSPLRRRMIEYLTIRKFAAKTQHDYIQRVKHFAAFLGRSLDLATFEDVRRYQLHLATGRADVPTVNQAVSRLRFFFRVTLKRHAQLYAIEAMLRGSSPDIQLAARKEHSLPSVTALKRRSGPQPKTDSFIRRDGLPALLQAAQFGADSHFFCPAEGN